MYATPTADMELEQRLDAYARARLSLAPDAAARIRERVMRDARRTLASAPSGSGLRVIGGRTISTASDRARARLRRGGALLAAAGLTVGILGGTVAAAQPGGPLYSARMWAEELTLPADKSERAAAELVRLEARMTEIEAAARSGDRSAVAAAIAAYNAIADEALAEAGADQTRLEGLRVALDRHLATLRAVAAVVPTSANEAIERNIDRAVEHNNATLRSIVSTPTPTNAGGASGGNQGTEPNGQPAQSTKPETSSDPAVTGPDATQKPHPSPKPEPPAAAATPAPGPDQDPGGGKPSEKPGQDPGGKGSSQP